MSRAGAQPARALVRDGEPLGWILDGVENPLYVSQRYARIRVCQPEEAKVIRARGLFEQVRGRRFTHISGVSGNRCSAQSALPASARTPRRSHMVGVVDVAQQAETLSPSTGLPVDGGHSLARIFLTGLSPCDGPVRDAAVSMAIPLFMFAGRRERGPLESVPGASVVCPSCPNLHVPTAKRHSPGETEPVSRGGRPFHGEADKRHLRQIRAAPEVQTAGCAYYSPMSCE